MVAINISATAKGAGEKAVKGDNQTIRLVYDDYCKGKGITMIMSKGRVEYPDFHFIIQHEELEKILEFIKSAK